MKTRGRKWYNAFVDRGFSFKKGKDGWDTYKMGYSLPLAKRMK